MKKAKAPARAVAKAKVTKAAKKSAPPVKSIPKADLKDGKEAWKKAGFPLEEQELENPAESQS